MLRQLRFLSQRTFGMEGARLEKASEANGCLMIGCGIAASVHRSQSGEATGAGEGREGIHRLVGGKRRRVQRRSRADWLCASAALLRDLQGVGRGASARSGAGSGGRVRVAGTAGAPARTGL